MLFSNTGQAPTILLIPLVLWYEHENIWLICGFAFIRSCFNTIFQPALQSFIPMLFPPEQNVKINAILITSGHVAWMIRPFFAGILLSILSIKYLLNNEFFLDNESEYFKFLIYI